MYLPWYLYSKFPSAFPLHKELGHSTAGGVVPVIGGLVMAAAAKNCKTKFFLEVRISFKNTKYQSIIYLSIGLTKFQSEIMLNIFKNKKYIPAIKAKATKSFILMFNCRFVFLTSDYDFYLQFEVVFIL